MDKIQYLKEALRQEKWKWRAWILELIMVTKLPKLNELSAMTDPDDALLRLFTDDEATGYFTFLPESQEPVRLTSDGIGKPLFHWLEGVDLETGDLPNVVEPVRASVGNIIYNAMVLSYSFGNKIPFVTGRVNAKAIEKHISLNLRQDSEGDEPSPDHFYVHELLRYMDATSALAGLAMACVPTGTEKSMVVDPAILKRRDELFAQYGDQLRDPAILSKVEAELVAMDKASFAGDAAEGFYISGKSWDVSRKKAFISYGNEGGLGGEPRLIKNSLKEGMNVEDIPAHADSIRAASYSRGAETALGGELVKYLYRIFQNTSIVTDDCGTTVGMPIYVTEANVESLPGRFLLSGQPIGGKNIKGPTNAWTMLGKNIAIRSPLYCKAKAPSFCMKCMGQQYAGTPNALHIAAADVGSILMNCFMKAMHGKANKTARIEKDNCFE